MTAAVPVDVAAPARGRADLVRALGVLAEPPGPAQARMAGLLGLPEPTGADWTEAFVVQLVPHAAIYLGAEGMLGGAAADRVAGFWRALHLPVPAEPDHLASLLGLYARLVDAEHEEPDRPRRTLRRQARAALVNEHLLSWLPAYAHAMTEAGPRPYAAWARLLRQTLLAEAVDLGVAQRLPVQLHAAPPVTAGNGLDDLLAGLLAPARSGVVLTRAHLAATARHAGLGLRLGNRRAVLRAMMEQDLAAVLTGLADRARSWVEVHRADQPAVGPAAEHWAARASATADLLEAAVLARSHGDRVPTEPEEQP